MSKKCNQLLKISKYNTVSCLSSIQNRKQHMNMIYFIHILNILFCMININNINYSLSNILGRINNIKKYQFLSKYDIQA